MTQFDFNKDTGIPGMVLITPFSAEDERGVFVKDYSEQALREHGISHPLLETFYSSNRKGVVRGLHFQGVHPQAKLVSCISGRIFDAVADLREGSSAFGKWRAYELSADNHLELLVPAGCVHGFMALEDSVVAYKCSENFCKEGDSGVQYDCPELGIAWPWEQIGGKNFVIRSAKDRSLPGFTTAVDILNRDLYLFEDSSYLK